MRVAVVGIGAISGNHINALIKNGQEIVALCDIVKEKAINSVDFYNLNAKVYTDYDEMLDAEKLDAVHICTPHYLHVPMCIKALERGINVLCEKPLAINFEQLLELETAVKNSKATLGVCLQNRYNASILYLKDYLKDKEITSASATLVWKRDAEYYAQGEWRGKWATEGGGVMINQAVHALDALQWFCGFPESVTAQISNNSLKGVIEVEDTAYGMFTLKNGGNFIINATNSAKFPFPIYYTFRAGSETITLVNDDIIINKQYISKSDNLEVVGKEVWGVGHVGLIKEFYTCLKTGKKFPIDFYEGSKVIKLILSMYKSNGENIEIK